MKILLIAAVICFAIALLGATSVVTGVNVIAWIASGLFAWALDNALGGYLLAVPARRQTPQ